jgi:hypothetical protein
MPFMLVDSTYIEQKAGAGAANLGGGNTSVTEI